MSLVSLNKNELIVAFDKVFDKNISEILKRFSLKKKRNYVTLGKEIVDTLNYIFDNSEEALLNYLYLKYDIVSRGEDYPKEEFIDNVLINLITPEVIEVIDDYIEKNYKPLLDEKTEKSDNVNEELQFTDEHAKIINKTSMAMKFVIPLITEYLERKEINQSDELIFSIFTRLYEPFTPEGVDILNKIHKLIDSRIVATRYSDRVIWAYLKNLSIDPEILKRNFNRKIHINIVPKLDPKKNVISFFHAVIRNLIRFQFKFNFPLDYRPLNLNRTDSEGLSDFDKLEINMVRLDEGMGMIKRVSVSEEVRKWLRKIAVDYDFQLGPEELDYYRNKIVINKIQQNLLFLFFADRMGGYQNLYNLNLDEYVALCVTTKKWMEENGFPILAKYITGVPERYAEKTTINKRKFLQKLMDSKKYNNLLNDKYYHVVTNLVGSSSIERIIAGLKTNKFYTLPDYPGDEEPQVIDERIEAISDEVLNFLEII